MQQRHGATCVQPAKRQVELLVRWGHKSDSGLKSQVGSNASAKLVLPESKARRPLITAEHISEAVTQILGVSERFRENLRHSCGCAQHKVTMDNDRAAETTERQGVNPPVAGVHGLFARGNFVGV